MTIYDNDDDNNNFQEYGLSSMKPSMDYTKTAPVRRRRGGGRW